MDQVRVTLGDQVRVVPATEALSAGDDLMLRFPGLAAVHGRPSFESFKAEEDRVPVEPGYSEFGPGRQVVDQAARERIEAQHAVLRASGVDVKTSRQLYATGTRMAREGYATQAHRRVEHEEKQLLRDVGADLCSRVREERRKDFVVTAGEFAAAIRVGRRVSAFGLALSEQAIRGLLARLESPALSYVLGLRDRIGESLAQAKQAEQGSSRDALLAAANADLAEVGEVVRYECRRAPEVELKVRSREGVGDVFAVVSPAYSPADAPEVLDLIVGDMPADARGTFAYDAHSTAWEIRASVWTPTPVEQQAVGEPFEGYVSFQGRDNGTSRLRGGGGVTMLACLNAGTYVAEGRNASRVHRGRVLVDVESMVRDSMRAIDALCAAWGTARKQVVEHDDLVGLPLSKAIPGIWWGELGNRKGELAGVLRGRTAEHVEHLTEAYFSERRDPRRLVRSDLAQAWTRYIQDQPAPVRRDAEAAVGAWLVSGRPVRFEARD